MDGWAASAFACGAFVPVAGDGAGGVAGPLLASRIVVSASVSISGEFEPLGPAAAEVVEAAGGGDAGVGAGGTVGSGAAGAAGGAAAAAVAIAVSLASAAAAATSG